MLENVLKSLQTYEEGWKEVERGLTPESFIKTIASAEVVPSTYGQSICLHLIGGGLQYIPISTKTTNIYCAGDKVDMSEVTLIVLEKNGQTILRAE